MFWALAGAWREEIGYGVADASVPNSKRPLNVVEKCIMM
jgi:hypothetical protein